MVAINYAFREVSCKIVYYGPGLSGKTTNLQYVHKKVPGQVRGELISLATDTDRTLFFDFLPLNLGAIQGFTTKFQLYTVPGQVFYNATRKLVLRGVDGLVFVADSQKSKMDENKESLSNLLENLQEYGYNIEEIPFIIQYNKRDLPDINTVEEIQQILNQWGVPYFEAVAVKGIGVFDTLKGICKMVIENLKSKSKLAPAGETAAAASTQPEVPAKPAPTAASLPQEIHGRDLAPLEPKPMVLERETDVTHVIPSQVRKNMETPAARMEEKIRLERESESEGELITSGVTPRTERIASRESNTASPGNVATGGSPSPESWKPVHRPGTDRVTTPPTPVNLDQPVHRDQSPKPKNKKRSLIGKLFKSLFGA